MSEKEEQPPNYITKFILGILLLFLNALVTMMLWNGYFIIVFPSVHAISYFQAMALGILGRSIFSRVSV